jgi:hypothetical protein
MDRMPVPRDASVMRKTFRVLFAVLLATAAVGLPGVVAAAADTPLITVQIEGGYGGVVPRGGWAPVQVNVTNHGPDIKATLKLSATSNTQNGFGGAGPIFRGGTILPATGVLPGFPFPVPVASPGGPATSGPTVTQKLDVVLPAGTTKHFTAYLPANPGTWRADVVVPSGKTAATAATEVSQANSSLSVAVVSDDANALNQIGSIQSLSQTFQGQPQLIHLAPAGLPDAAAALSSFGLVAITNATTDSLTAAQRRALDDYVAAGGSVLVTGGGAWRKTQAGLPTDLVAMEVSGVQGVPGLPGLASSLGNPAVPGSVDVATGTRRSGVTVEAEGQVPILVEARVGRGRVLYSAVDPSAEPMASWSGTLPLLRQVLVRAAGDTADGQNSSPFPVSGKGVQAKGSSLFQALSNIPSLDLPSPLLIALALIVFIVLVGPVNYFFLRRIHRPDLAWSTIPLLVVMSAGSIYGIGLKTRGTDVLADRVRLVYLRNGSSRAYVNAGTGVFAPHSGTHAVSTVNGSLVTTLAGGTQFFMGGNIPIPLPFPGSSGATGALTVNNRNPPTVGMTWPNADSIQAFGEEYAETQSGTLDAHLAVTNGRLTGTIVNHTATTITDAVVLSGSAYSTFGAIRPGASVSVDIPLPAAGSTGIIVGQSFTLPQQIYLHAPVSCNSSATCNVPGVTYQLGRPTARQREAQRRSDVLGGILGQSVLDVAQPMFVGWTTAASGTVRVDGHRAQLNELSAYILPLEAGTTGSSLVAGRVTARAVDATGYLATLNPKGPGIGAFLPPNGATTFEFALGGPGWQKLSLTETVPTGGPPGFGNPTTTVYNFRTSAWDPITLSTAQTTDIPAPADHTSPDGLLRIRVATGNSPAMLGTIDVSGTQAGTA